MTPSDEIAQRLARTQAHLDEVRVRLAELREQIDDCRRVGDAEEWLRLTFERDNLADSVIPHVEATIASERAEWREARVGELKTQIAPLSRRLATLTQRFREVEAELGTLSDPKTKFRVAHIHLDSDELDRHQKLLSQRERLQGEAREVSEERAPLEMELFDLDPDSAPIDPHAKPPETFIAARVLRERQPRRPNRGTVTMRWM